MPNDTRTGRATEAQQAYLRRLYAQAFAARVTVGYDTTHAAESISKAAASAEITRIKSLLEATR